MKKENILYKESSWSLQSYLAKTWRIWFIVLGAIGVALYAIYQLAQYKYFDEELIWNKILDVNILAIRSNSSVLVSSPLIAQNNYEIDLGYFCNPNKSLAGKKIPMKVLLFKRNYNGTYFLKFPEAKNKICH